MISKYALIVRVGDQVVTARGRATVVSIDSSKLYETSHTDGQLYSYSAIHNEQVGVIDAVLFDNRSNNPRANRSSETCK